MNQVDKRVEFKVKMPVELKQRLYNRSRRDLRSMRSELLYLLSEALAEDTDTNIDTNNNGQDAA